MRTFARNVKKKKKQRLRVSIPSEIRTDKPFSIKKWHTFFDNCRPPYNSLIQFKNWNLKINRESWIVKKSLDPNYS